VKYSSSWKYSITSNACAIKPSGRKENHNARKRCQGTTHRNQGKLAKDNMFATFIAARKIKIVNNSQDPI